MYLVGEHVHQPKGWLSPGTLEIDATGFIVGASSGPPPAGTHPDEIQRVQGFVIPGLPNVHSHAFQRCLVGRTEHALHGVRDDFWSWRSRMLDVAARISPEQLEAIAGLLYAEMLEAGMTSVGEFHYLHHDEQGRPYADPAELSLRILSAAERAGIGLTHLPVLYMRCGFEQPPTDEYRRFVHRDVETFLQLVDAEKKHFRSDRNARLGVAPHSLRAVPADAVATLVRTVRATDASMPIHIHAAEQQAEVEACLGHLGTRPIAWLAQEALLDRGSCLVHATHADDRERAEIIASGAVVGLCPTTEANLGDGFFEAASFLDGGGQFAIGSDSHVSVSAAEELRWLEYGERLRTERRNVLLGPPTTRSADAPLHVGRFLFDHAVRGGARALGQPVGALIAKRRADLVVLDGEHPTLVAHGVDTVLDAFVFGGQVGCVRDVMVAGRWRVRNGRHLERDRLAPPYRSAVMAIFGTGTQPPDVPPSGSRPRPAGSDSE